MKFITALSLFCLWAFAQETEAILIHLEGRVDILGKDSGQRRGTKGMTLKEGEGVRTLGDGLAVLALPDGSRLKLRESSFMRLTQFTRGNLGRVTKLDLIGGSVFTKVAKLGASDQFTLMAASAVAGVRGTEFFTAHGPKRPDGSEDVWLCVNEGEVEVKGAGGPEAKVKAGEGIQVKAGKEVTPPKAYAWTKNLNWNMDAGKGAVKDRTRLEKIYGDPAGVPYD